MKNFLLNTTAAFIIASTWASTISAQITPDQLKQFIQAGKYADDPDLKELYTRMNYKTAWIQNENTVNRNVFFNTLKLAAGMGLRETDYQYNYIHAYRSNTLRLENSEDSMEAEIRFTEAAIHFYKDIAYGNIKPALGHNGLNYAPQCQNIPEILTGHLSKSSLHVLPALLSPPLPEITAIENRIRMLNVIMADSGFRDIPVVSNKVIRSNTALVKRLTQLGIITAADKILHDSTLKQKLKEAQLQFGLLADGTLRSTIMAELNIPLGTRMEQLNLSVNYYRWLYCLVQNQSVIVVNIPAAYLKVYRKNDVLLQMRMIVGKPSTPTPTLTSKVDEVILYPYWHVPFSIATKELLPAIKRNPGYIDAGNYQVLNKAGKIVDPYSINWHALSRSYFPYIIRQSTGCDNALGLLKLNFYSPFGVYLHDTPNRNLFSMSKRYFSHGCMRMEKPMEMGRLVLTKNHIAIDTLDQKSCLVNQSPIIVKADEHMPVIVWYNPAGIDQTGRVQFYEDIYRRFNWQQKPKK